MIPVECLFGLGAAGVGGLGTYAALRLRGWKNRKEISSLLDQQPPKSNYIDYNEVVEIRRNLGEYLRAPGVLRKGDPEE